MSHVTATLKTMLVGTLTAGAILSGGVPLALADQGVGPAGLDAEANYMVAMKKAGLKFSKSEIVPVVKIGYLFCDLNNAYVAAGRGSDVHEILNKQSPQQRDFYAIAITNLCPSPASPSSDPAKRQQALDALGPTTQRTLSKIGDQMGKIADEPLITDKDTDFKPDQQEPDHGKSYSPGN
jgi:hypothetical protein